MGSNPKEWKMIGSKGDEYSLSINNHGTVSCTCIGFQNYEKCYHSSYIKNCIEKGIEPKKILKRTIKIF